MYKDYIYPFFALFIAMMAASLWLSACASAPAGSEDASAVSTSTIPVQEIALWAVRLQDSGRECKVSLVESQIWIWCDFPPTVTIEVQREPKESIDEP